MKIGIFGAGSLGTLYGGMLSASGTEVILYARKSNKNRTLLEKNSAEVRNPDNTAITSTLKITSVISDLASCDYILLCVKSYSTEEAAAQLSAASPTGIIVTFQNGWGNIDILKKYFPCSRIAAGTTSEGAYLIEPGIAVHGGHGITSISMLSGDNAELEPLVTSLNHAGLKAEINPDHIKAIWKKLIINAVINPLTAIAEVKNIQVSSSPYLRSAGEEIIKECVLCSQAEGINLTYDEMHDAVFSVAEKTGSNRSSMLQDILAGRKTEIDFISGAIEKTGLKYNIDTKVNSLLKNIVKAKEAKNE
ncbi:MAG: 2-dehydropantoate 2-reductase [Spirochaetia bacterium]|nr:2-dehydropantoate 2-reductase [Spirochaetia bacterium]